LCRWKCDARQDRPNTFILQQASFTESQGTIEWADVYKGTARTTMLSNLAAQTSYRFRVCAINSSGRGAWSDEVVLTTGTPKAPTDLLLLSSTATSLQIAWSGEPSLRSRHCTYTLEMNRAEPSADGELGGDWEEAYTGPSRTCRVKALKPDHSYRLAAAPCRSNPFFTPCFPEVCMTRVCDGMSMS